MLSVLIVDDEVVICRMISKLIDWDGLGLVLSGEAHNAESAYQHVIKHNPSIVITDIKMPGTDGMGFIERVRKLGADTSFIVISGYKEFDYAKGMLKFGVEDYLLKPIQKKELNDVLLRIKRKRESQNSKGYAAQCRELFMKKLLEDASQFAGKSLEDINRIYSFQFMRGVFGVVGLKADFRLSACADEMVWREINKRISDTALKMLSESCQEAEAIISAGRVYYIVNSTMCPADFVKSVKESVDKLIPMNAQKYELDRLSAALDGFSDGPEGLTPCLRTIDSALDHRADLVKNELIYKSCARIDGGSEALKELCAEFDSRMRQFEETLDTEEYLRWLRERIQDERLCCFDCAQVVRRSAEDLMALLEESRLLTADDATMARYIENADSKQKLAEIVGVYLPAIFERWASARKESEKKPVRDVKAYIDKHYREEVSLELLARLVFLNPAYLSSMFKKETGMGITEYLIQVRIQHAKQLLGNTPMSIAAVASDVGYKDVRHFSKVFLRIAGIKPSEYRKYHS